MLHVKIDDDIIVSCNKSSEDVHYGNHYIRESEKASGFIKGFRYETYTDMGS
jgi:hypothetical protein